MMCLDSHIRELRRIQIACPEINHKRGAARSRAVCVACLCSALVVGFRILGGGLEGST